MPWTFNIAGFGEVVSGGGRAVSTHTTTKPKSPPAFHGSTNSVSHERTRS